MAEVIQQSLSWQPLPLFLPALAARGRGAQEPPRFQPVPRHFEPVSTEGNPSDATEALSGPFLSLLDAAFELEQLALVAPSGFGKTVELSRLLLASAERARADPGAPLPVLVDLAHWTGTASLFDFVSSGLAGTSPAAPIAHGRFSAHRRLSAHLEQLLAAGRILLILDGLDDLPRSAFPRALREIASFRRAYHRSLFVYSCRWQETAACLAVPSLELLGLSPDSQRTLLTSCFPEQAESVLQALSEKRPDLLPLARSPFLLLVMASVYVRTGSFPANRSLLLRSFVRTLLAQHTEPLETDTTVRALAQLALAIHRECGARSAVPRPWAEKQVEDWLVRNSAEGEALPNVLDSALRASVVVERPGNTVRFGFPLAQEYLAAEALLEAAAFNPLPEGTFGHRYWGEVLEFASGLLPDSSRLVAQLLAVDLFLAARCSAAAQSVEASLADSVAGRLREKMAAKFRAERIAAAQSLVILRGEEAIFELLSSLPHSDPIERTGWRRALTQLQPNELLPHLTALFKHKEPATRRWTAELLSALHSPAALPGLLRLAYDADARVRAQVAVGLSELLGEGALPYLAWLLRDNDYTVRIRVSQILRHFDPEAVLAAINPARVQRSRLPTPAPSGPAPTAGDPLESKLTLLLTDSLREVRWATPEALVARGRDLLGATLLSLLSRRYSLDVRWLAVELLGKLKVKEAVPDLLALLSDKDSDLQAIAARSLSLIDPEGAIEPMLSLLADDDWHVRGAAVQALAGFRSDRVLAHLLLLLSDDDSYVRRLTAQVLVELTGQAAVPALIEQLADEDGEVRASAAEMLGRLGAAEAVGPLAARLEDPVQEVRGAALQALGRIGEQAAEPYLIPLLTDRSHYVRLTAAQVLGRLRAEAAVPALTQLLDDESEQVQLYALRSLRAIQPEAVFIGPRELAGMPRAAPPEDLNRRPHRATAANLAQVAAFLGHPHEQLRQEAIRALQEGAGEAHLPLLFLLLSYDDPRVYDAAYEILAVVRHRLNLPEK